MFYKCKVKKALGKMALWLLPKRRFLCVGAKANVPLCGGKKMNKKCAVGKKKKYTRVSKECRLTRCPVSIWSVFVCLSVKMVYFSCPSVRYCQVARSSFTLAYNHPNIYNCWYSLYVAPASIAHSRLRWRGMCRGTAFFNSG